MQTFALKVVVLQLPTYVQYEDNVSYYVIRIIAVATDIASARDNTIL